MAFVLKGIYYFYVSYHLRISSGTQQKTSIVFVRHFKLLNLVLIVLFFSLLLNHQNGVSISFKEVILHLVSKYEKHLYKCPLKKEIKYKF